MTAPTAVVVRTQGTRSLWLREALISVARQGSVCSCPPVAIVVVDPPAHADRTRALYDTGSLAQAISSSSIVLLSELPGPPAAANAGVRRALALGSPSILFLDDDDVLKPWCVAELEKALLADPEASAAYGDVQVYACDATTNSPVTRSILYSGPFVHDQLRTRGQRPFNAFLFRASCFARGSAFHDVDVPCEDYGFLLRLAGAGRRFVHVPQLVAEYRQRSTAEDYARRERIALACVAIRAREAARGSAPDPAKGLRPLDSVDPSVARDGG